MSVGAAAERTAPCVDALREIDALEALCERVVVHDPDGPVVLRRLGAGPPLVLLHGGHGSWLHWIRNATALAHAHTVWMPDLPGYGESSSAVPADLGQLVGRLHRCLARVAGPDSAWRLVGFSFGTVVAGCLAAGGAGGRRLALVGPVGHGGHRRQVLAPVSWKHLEPRGRGAEWERVMRHNLRAQMLHRPGAVDATALEVHWRSCLQSRFYSKPYSRSSLLRERLAAFSGPTLLLWGQDDVTASPEVFDRAFWGPGGTCQIVVQPDCGHWAMYEAPVPVVQAIRHFIE